MTLKLKQSLRKFNMKRFELILISLIVLLFACNTNTNINTKKKVKVMLGWTPGPDHAFLLYGIENGVFDSLGIDVEWLPTRGSSVVATALANENVEFGFLSGDYTIVARHKGFPIKALTTIYHETATTIFSLKEKNIKVPTDLRGKRIGVLTQSAAYPQVLSFLSDHNINKNDFTEVFSKGAISELLLDHVDAMMHYTNYAPIEMITKGKREINEILLKDYGINIYGTTLVANENFMRKNPELTRKFVFGILKSLELAKNNHQAVIESLLKADVNLDSLEMESALKKTEEMIYTPMTDSLGLGYMLKKDWEETLKTTSHFLNEKIDINIDSLYYLKYLEFYYENKK